MQLGPPVAVAVVEAGSCSSGVTPRLGPSMCSRCGPQKTKGEKGRHLRKGTMSFSQRSGPSRPPAPGWSLEPDKRSGLPEEPCGEKGHVPGMSHGHSGTGRDKGWGCGCSL